MLALEIIVGIIAAGIVIGVIAKYIYNQKHGIDTDCEICKSRSKKVIKNIKKELDKEIICE